MRRGQQESAFQWIYVLIAGGAFLFMFFVIFKSCASSGEDTRSAGSFDSGINSLSTAVWERESTTTISSPTGDIICPAGTLTISSGKNTKSLDRLPIFISPTIGDITGVLTRDVFSPPGIEPLPLGSLAYGVDSRVKYYLIDDGNNGYAQNLISIVNDTNIESGFRIVKNQVANSEMVNSVNKQTSGTAVIVLFKSNHHVLADLPPVDLREGTIFLYVNTTANSVTYFENNDGAWVEKGTSNYVNTKVKYFLLGAIVSAKKQNYECSKSAIVDRMEKITTVYMMRSDVLRNSNAALISSDCKLLHNNSFVYLNTTNYQISQGRKDAYLQRLLGSNNLTITQEIIRYTTDCPVIS